jgi:hypothetical protein
VAFCVPSWRFVFRRGVLCSAVAFCFLSYAARVVLDQIRVFGW